MQPGKPQHQLKMTETGDLKGKGFRVGAMDTELGG